MDQLAARTQYLTKIQSTLASFNTQFEQLVKSLGWTVESLTKKTKEFGDDAGEDQQAETSHKKDETEKEFVTESKDYEKLYNDLVANLPNQPNKNSDKSQTQILAEMLELERNTKRRRISYKNKVHTRNKSQTEVLRALVQEQMDVLKDIAGQSKDDDTPLESSHQSEADSGGLIQVNIHGGNPHTAWKRIDRLLEEAQGTSDLKRKSSSHRASPSPENRRKRHQNDKHYSRHESDRNKRRDNRRYDDAHDCRSQHDDRWKEDPTSKQRDRYNQGRSRDYKERHADRWHDDDHMVARSRSSHHDDIDSEESHSRNRLRCDRRTDKTTDEHDDRDYRRGRYDRHGSDTNNQNDDHSSEHGRSGRYWENINDNEKKYVDKSSSYQIKELRGSERSKASEYIEDSRYTKVSNDRDSRSLSSHRTDQRQSLDTKDEKSLHLDDNHCSNTKRSSRSSSESDACSDSRSEKSYSPEKKSKRRKKKKKKKEKRKKKRRRSRSSS